MNSCFKYRLNQLEYLLHGYLIFPATYGRSVKNELKFKYANKKYIIIKNLVIKVNQVKEHLLLPHF